MFFWDIRPLGVGRLLTPASSPIVRGTSESSTTTPLLLISTFLVALSVSLRLAVLGKGVGMPPGPAGGGGAGMWQVSGVARASPPALVAAGRDIAQAPFGFEFVRLSRGGPSCRRSRSP